jgi:hypothetical protein
MSEPVGGALVEQAEQQQQQQQQGRARGRQEDDRC